MTSPAIQCMVPTGDGFQATDGTVFYPATLYNVASRNIGIIEVNGEHKTVYSDTLYANPNVASAAALRMRNEYEDTRTEVIF